MPDGEYQAQMQRLDDLMREAEATVDPNARTILQEFAAGLLELHAKALSRLLKHVGNAGPAGTAILDACGDDELVNAVFVLHGLNPVDVNERVERALVRVRPYLASHGGAVELLSISPEGQVTLRLEGSCHGCPSSRVTLQTKIEHEIYAAAPEVTSIALEEASAQPDAAPVTGFVPLTRIGINASHVQAAAS